MAQQINNSNLFSTVTNYSGRQPDNVQNVKQFVTSLGSLATWVFKKLYNNILVLTPGNANASVLIPKNLYVLGSIFNPSDSKLKSNIVDLAAADSARLRQLQPKQFTYHFEQHRHPHFGFLAQDMEQVFPTLVRDQETGFKAINVQELVPLLVHRINVLETRLEQLEQEQQQHLSHEDKDEKSPEDGGLDRSTLL